MIRVFSLLCLLCLAQTAWAQPQDVDNDGDGFTPLSGDCNDSDASIYAGAPELCDSKDNDCDNVVDNPPDDDGDGLHECNGDCDDNNAAVYTGNTEICDAFDNDCDGSINEGPGPNGFLRRSCYSGAAGTSGVGLCTSGTEECSSSSAPFWSGICVGEVTPVTEICDGSDNDCDGDTDEGFDNDNDGVTSCGGDCDDGDADRFPGNNEVCDGKDNDCNAATQDSNFTRACYSGPGSTRGVGVCSDGTESCSGPSGWSGTCSGQVVPGTEICNGLDDDCDGDVDEGFDNDNDGVTTCGGDCDDNDANRFPGNPEVCDGLDNDCDGDTDERNAQGDPLRRSCYSGPGNTRNRGVCQAGTQTCTSGSFGSCVGEVTPGTETCNGFDDDCDGDTDEDFDQDNDGSSSCGGDCDDNDANRFPGNPEVCDGLDNDCDGDTDERNAQGDPLRQSCYTGPSGTRNNGICQGGTQTCSSGSFGMCVGQVTPATESCNGLDDDCDRDVDEDFDQDNDGVTTCGGDCDDTNASVRPGIAEICDGIDNDCDGDVDEDFDDDGDGFTTCGGDCDDSDSSVFPGAVEACNGVDDDCDGLVDEDFTDADGDGFVNCGPNADCNDSDANVNPAANERCNGVDDDCDGLTDERNGRGDPLRRGCYTGPGGTAGVGVCRGGTQECVGGSFGTCVGEVVPSPEVCDQANNDCDEDIDEGFDMDGDGFVSCGPNRDCDDGNAAVNPDATEVCDGADNDCDGNLDERNAQGDPLRQSCYSGPAGTDGTGVCARGNQECQNGSFGACQDEVVPTPESCDQVDNDCDGDIDEDFDQDGDGFISCGPAADCDDGNAARNPGEIEVCDGLDNDCDNDVDEDARGDPLTRPCYTGPDGTEDVGACMGGVNLCDGPNGFSSVCTGEVVPQPESCNEVDDDCDGVVDQAFDRDMDGFVACVDDCDDNDPLVNPDALEICNNVDDDCDGFIDGNETRCYEGPVGTATVGECRPGRATCVMGMPSGLCMGQVLPTEEVCDELDNDCDGEVDEGFDLDGDGVNSCDGDCDDNNAFVAPGLSERCDCADNDCDGVLDELPFGSEGSICEFGACHDFDGDGFTNCDGDCNDLDATAFPGGAEVCGDSVDNDCDGFVDEDVDEDNDGVTTCDGDCDDRFAAIRPGGPELCDGFDNNCDGQVDEGYDQDGDFATTCVGDCDDTDRFRSPFRKEVCGNGIDDDCDGIVDPEVDADGDGFTVCDGDCNDFNPTVFPGAPEVCDGIDNNCVDGFDEGFDEDGDTFTACFGDCNDQDPAINPFAREVQDDVDNNCNGEVDEGEEDGDEDLFSFLCGDCNDDNPNISPQTPDVCDGIDNDCDGLVDRDPFGVSTCATCNDVDGDGFLDCEGDCEDTDPTINPAAEEVCDGIDNNCDTLVDLDPDSRENLCVSTGGDMGVFDGGGSRDGGSAGRLDAGVEDAGGSTSPPPPRPPFDRPTIDPDDPLAVTCGCSSMDRSLGDLSSLGLGLFLLAALVGRRAVPARSRRRSQRHRGNG